jgi:transposase-like protein
MGQNVSDQKSNQLLEYAVDSLLKNFNPENKQIMKKLHFFKLMNLLDTRLKKQGVDIKYPSYWYKYGSYSEIRFLEAIIPRFSNRYQRNDFIMPPYPARKSYNIELKTKSIIDRTVRYLCEQFRYQDEYGLKAKRTSYNLNSPYEFNTIFQEYIATLNSETTSLFSRREQLETILNKLLFSFPEKDFPELIDIHLEWDDTTRLILDCIPETENRQQTLVKELMDIFWDIYSKGVRIKHNWNIPPETVEEWKASYEKTISDSYKKIEDIRKGTILNSCETSEGEYKAIKKLMQKAYDISLHEY